MPERFQGEIVKYGKFMTEELLQSNKTDPALSALRHLVFALWDREYGRFPLIYGKDYGDSYSKEVADLRLLLIKKYGLKDKEASGIIIKDPDKNFRDIISDIIKGKSDSLPKTDKIDALAHCYYQHTDFEDDPHGDWIQFLKTFRNSPAVTALPESQASLQETDAGEPKPFKFLGFNLCSPRSFISLLVICCTCILGAGITCIYFVKNSPLQIAASNESIIISWIQILILFAFIFIYFREHAQHRPHNNSLTNQTILQFESSWMAILISLTFLYLWFAMEGWLITINSSVYLSAGDVLTSISSFLFYYAYCILETKSLSTLQEPKRNKYFKINIFISGLICLILCLLSMLNRFRLIPESYEFVVKLMFAIYPAVTISLFIERLSSRTLIKSRTIIPFLYAYCALQLGYIFKDGSTAAGTGLNSNFAWILIAALLLKFFLFLEVNKILDNNRIENYLRQVLFLKKND